MLKTKDKEKNLKAARGDKDILYIRCYQLASLELKLLRWRSGCQKLSVDAYLWGRKGSRGQREVKL